MDNNSQAPNQLNEIYPPRAFFRDKGMRLFGSDADIKFEQLEQAHRSQINAPAVSAYVPKAGGVLVLHAGDKYPTQQWAFKEGIICGDMAKRSILNILKFAASKPMRYIVPLFVLLPRPLKRAIVDSVVRNYFDFTNTMYERIGAVWNEEFYCTMVREVNRTLTKILDGHPLRQRIVDVPCMMLEFDDAYRFIFQDAAGEIDREAVITNPFGELARVLRIVQGRGPGTSDKIGQIARILPLARFVPGLRDLVVAFCREVDLEKLKLNKYDWYKCSLWGGYNFGGLDNKQRLAMRMALDAEAEREPTEENKVDKKIKYQ